MICRVLRKIQTGLVLLMLAAPAVCAEETFSADALKGIGRVAVSVEGIARDFERYGLDEETLKQRVASRLTAAGVPVVDTQTAVAAPDAGQLLVKLVTNRDQYAFYFYAVSVRLNRKLPLDATGASFTSTEVWSEARHGVINPSDFKAVYGYVDTLLERFIVTHGRHNAGRQTAAMDIDS